MKRVIVVGGGVTGLAAAYFLRSRARVVLLEAGSRWGGVVATDRAGGFLMEGGPDGFAGTSRLLPTLCRELGLEAVPARSSRKAVREGGRILRLSPFDGLLSWKGRLRAALDLVLPPGPPAADESLGAFLRRRLGREALERLADPVLSGIYLARPSELSLRATWPDLVRGGVPPRSLILGWRRLRGSWGPRATLKGGMDGLVERLRSSMPEVGIRLGAPVLGIEPAWRVRAAGEVLEADAVVLALPAPAAGALVRRFAPVLAGALSRLRQVSCSTVSLGFRGEAPVEATSLFLSPSEEAPALLTFPSEKFEGRAPRGHWLVRCFFRGTPGDAAELARAAVVRILGFREEPVLERTFLWPGARPVYEVGHEERVRRIEELLPPGLYLAGASYRGLSLEDCVRDARRAADRIVGEG